MAPCSLPRPSHSSNSIHSLLGCEKPSRLDAVRQEKESYDGCNDGLSRLAVSDITNAKRVDAPSNPR